MVINWALKGSRVFVSLILAWHFNYIRQFFFKAPTTLLDLSTVLCVLYSGWGNRVKYDSVVKAY